MADEELELKTPAGYLIKVRAAKQTCVVFLENRPEVPRSGANKSMDQPVPSILFIGPNFTPVTPAGRFTLAVNRNFRLQVPYKHGTGDVRHLTLACGSAADQFPVMVQQFENAKTYASKDAGTYRFIVADELTSRLDLVTLKGRNPEAQILVLHPERQREVPQAKAGVDQTKVRANDLLASGMAEDAQNAVFMARVYLRNLDLRRVKELVMERSLTEEEIVFVRTFLQIMIKNEHGKSELEAAHDELVTLNEIYRLVGIVDSDKRNEFDAELDKGMLLSTARDMVTFIAKKRARAKSKDEEILFWEWEYRLNQQIAKGMAP